MNRWTRLVAPMLAGGVMMAMAPAAEADDAAMKAAFEKGKCVSCHSIKNVGIEKKVNEKTGKVRKGPDLSGVGLEHDAAFIVPWLKKEKETPSIYNKDKMVKHKKKFKGTDEELKALADWLAAQKTKVDVKDEGAEDEGDDKEE